MKVERWPKTQNESKEEERMNERLKERTGAKATEDRRDWGIYLAAH